MSDSNDGILEKLESLKILLPPDATPRVICFMGTEILFKVLFPFIKKHLKDKWGDKWKTEMVKRFNEHNKPRPKKVNDEIKWDLVALLNAIIVCWDVFSTTLKIKKKHKNFASELILTRNEIMHNDEFTREEADSALDTMIHIIQAMNGGEDAIGKLKILRQWVDQWIDSSPQTPAAQRPEKEKDAEYYLNQSIVNLYEKNYDKAMENYNKAIELDPNYVAAYTSRGLAESNLEKNQKTIKDYDKAIELDPNDAETYYNRGNAKLELEDYQEAIKDYDKAITLDPQNAYAYVCKGIAKAQSKDYRGAIKDFDKAIELNFNFSLVYIHRGIAKFKVEDYQGAIKDSTEAIRLDPKNLTAYGNRGNAKFALGDYQGAMKDYDIAKPLLKE